MANMGANKKTFQKSDRHTEKGKAQEASGSENAVFDQHKFLEILGSLVERAKKKKNMLEYQEISDAFQSMCLSAEQLENVLDYLEVHNVDVLRISNDDDDSDILIDDEDDVEVENIDLTVPDGVSIEDPVRMYLKEIGKVPLLSAEEEIDLAQKMENGMVAHEKIAILKGRRENARTDEERADLDREIQKLSLEQDQGEEAKKRLARSEEHTSELQSP